MYKRKCIQLYFIGSLLKCDCETHNYLAYLAVVVLLEQHMLYEAVFNVNINTLLNLI